MNSIQIIGGSCWVVLLLAAMLSYSSCSIVDNLPAGSINESTNGSSFIPSTTPVTVELPTSIKLIKINLISDSVGNTLRSGHVRRRMRLENSQQTFAVKSIKSAQSVLFNTPKLHPSHFAHDQYHNSDEIDAYLKSVRIHYPNITELINIGRTYQNRSIYVLKITHSKNSRKGILMDGGQHGREWISTASLLYVVQQLVTNDTLKPLLADMTWYILPVANPDGYAATWQGERLWRKTKTGAERCMVDMHESDRIKCNRCVGADPNRNWDIYWNNSRALDWKCSNEYPGTKPFSEPSVAALARYIMANRFHLQAYVNIHSYGLYIFHPYGYNEGTYPRDIVDIIRVAYRVKDEMSKVNGHKYFVGSPADLMYRAQGSGMDWVKKVAKIKYTLGIELPPDTGSPYGFRLPASQINKTGRELLAGLTAVAEAVKELRDLYV